MDEYTNNEMFQYADAVKHIKDQLIKEYADKLLATKPHEHDKRESYYYKSQALSDVLTDIESFLEEYPK